MIYNLLVGNKSDGIVFAKKVNCNNLVEALDLAMDAAIDLYELNLVEHDYGDCLKEAEQIIFEEDYENFEDYKVALEEYADDIYDSYMYDVIDYWAEEEDSEDIVIFEN